MWCAGALKSRELCAIQAGGGGEEAASCAGAIGAARIVVVRVILCHKATDANTATSAMAARIGDDL